MSRRMFDVKIILDEVNRRNRESTCPADTRECWNDILQFVLHEAGLYQGYEYLSEGMVPAGEKPGVVYEMNQESMTMKSISFPDETRRQYHSHSKLLK